MRVRDFFLLTLVCLIWAFNNVLSKIIVDNWAIPPLFYAALRFAVVALVMLPGCGRSRARLGGSC